VSVSVFDRELDQTHFEIDVLFESTCHGLFFRSIRFSEYLGARLFAVMNSFLERMHIMFSTLFITFMTDFLQTLSKVQVCYMPLGCFLEEFFVMARCSCTADMS
jgi:hypothetical protein